MLRKSSRQQQAAAAIMLLAGLIARAGQPGVRGDE
jgi:hypothetical protein